MVNCCHKLTICVSEPHMNTGFLFANLSGHFVAQLIYPHNILWAIIFSVILPHILASIMTSNDGKDTGFLILFFDSSYHYLQIIFSEERSNLFQYSGYCLIGVLLGYSAANFVALVKIMWTGYNQFYRNSPNQQSRDQMFTPDAARDDL